MPKLADGPQRDSETASFSTKQGVNLASQYVLGRIGGMVVTEGIICFYCKECGHEWANNPTLQAEPTATSKTIYLPRGECGGKLKMKLEQAGKRI